MPTYKANPTDKEQADIESAEFDSTVPVFANEATRNVGAPLGGGPNMTQGDEGQITHYDDHYGYDMSSLIGRARTGNNKWRGA